MSIYQFYARYENDVVVEVGIFPVKDTPANEEWVVISDPQYWLEKKRLERLAEEENSDVA
jgi:hypothetical protein